MTTTPSTTRLPAVGSSIIVTMRARVDLPQPEFAHHGQGAATGEREADAGHGAEQ